MTYTYTIKKDQKISIDIWPHLLGPGKMVCYRDQSCTGKEATMKTLEVFLDPDKEEMYFMLDGEIKYFNDYDFLPLEELIKKFHQGVSCQDFLATLLRESEDIGFISSSDIYPFNAFRGEVLIPYETEEKLKTKWEHKILLQHPSGVIGELFTSDLFDALCDGSVRLLSRKTYKKGETAAKTLEKRFEPR